MWSFRNSRQKIFGKVFLLDILWKYASSKVNIKKQIQDEGKKCFSNNQSFAYKNKVVGVIYLFNCKAWIHICVSTPSLDSQHSQRGLQAFLPCPHQGWREEATNDLQKLANWIMENMQTHIVFCRSPKRKGVLCSCSAPWKMSAGLGPCEAWLAPLLWAAQGGACRSCLSLTSGGSCLPFSPAISEEHGVECFCGRQRCYGVRAWDEVLQPFP